MGGEGEHVLERFHRWRQPERFQRAAERHGECRATGRRREETAQRDSVSQRACVNDRIKVWLLPPQQVQHTHTTRRVSGRVVSPPALSLRPLSALSLSLFSSRSPVLPFLPWCVVPGDRTSMRYGERTDLPGAAVVQAHGGDRGGRRGSGGHGGGGGGEGAECGSRGRPEAAPAEQHEHHLQIDDKPISKSPIFSVLFSWA